VTTPETWTWLVARATGFTAYGLVTVAVALGLALSLRWQSLRWPRLINNELHQFLVVLAGVFTALHGLSVWVDPFTAFSWREVFIPGASHYRPLWMALGIVAGYLGLALGLSTWLRPKIGFRTWRALHYLTYLVWALATVHGLGDGSDTRTQWAAAVYGLSALLVLSLTAVRIAKATTWPVVSRALVMAALVAVGLAGVAWAHGGPFQPGWNAIANNGHGSGGRGLYAAPATPPAHPAAWPTTAFSRPVSGTLTQTSSADGQGVVATLRLRLLGTPGGRLVVRIEAVPTDDGGAVITGSTVTLGPSSRPTADQGTVQAIRGDRILAAVQDASGQTWNVVLVLTGTSGWDGVTGTVWVTPAAQGP
jgi:DMSO/TMAO reductase YedYZ heme-binding membrane subunit